MEKMTSNGRLLLELTQPQPQPQTRLIFIIPRRPSLSPYQLVKCPNLSSSRSNPRSFRLEAKRWDSNAEPSSREKKRRWFTDLDPPEPVKVAGFDLGEIFHGLWVVKVFKPFGWFLPFVIVPLLLASGLKAFVLMVLGVTFAQSVVEVILLAFDKLLGRPEKIPERKAKTRKKPFPSTTASRKEMEEGTVENREAKNETSGYQSWVDANEGSIKNDENEKAASRNFGGWDDLDKPEFAQKRASGSRNRASGSRKKAVKKGKSSRKERSSTPLLLRLLIAVFPFLSSWIKIL